ncbi:MAG: DNA cytosine methyltransferase [Microcystis aeruginosa L111-01]|jgi:DNA (cytosine-5)-methyltransferase 1|nr:DNA cytosine methyltransferase [Microcystis aeruginosa W13-16]NCQ76167.1 DNA cytosine methyltransferase [Microcystis aeruginosa W13-13]NCQ80695.1 DNA cytosine methyltransferase [Microcystis aeruginosa W13-15]NCR24371.1 DNA cytosine methyltransferase [Microcystis aeruginosa L111-01]NCS46045.1 DNA cytosine methyltransferase [Microcystis aeruginosa BS11-05]NCS54874.1 DNA cytosine methyltransferase [Microcystis aeruginosa G13-05]TRT78874.1 MAG: DNA cytosine methyltransferase [Microcystis aerug
MRHTALSLFCGAGGCSLGFKQAGYEVLFASDIDKAAIRTYEANFPETDCVESDIQDLDFNKVLSNLGLAVGELDILIGGPPCQGFSTAGLRFWDDPRNSLLKQYIHALRTIKPKWFLMENVEGLLTADKGKYVYEAAVAFVRCGYQIRIEKVYAQEYGVPQRRKRVIIIGNRLGIDFKFPEPQMLTYGRIFRYSDVTLRHTIADLPKPSDNNREHLNYILQATSSWERYLRGTANKVVDHFFPRMTDLQVQRIKALKPGQTMKSLPVDLQHESFQKRANRRVMDGTPSEKRGGAPSGLKRLFFDEPSLTITGASTREFIHPDQDRPLTIREAARIQTFPDDFVFLGNASEKIQQIGNAIPPLVSYAFAKYIKDEYGFELQSDVSGRLLGFTLTKANAMSPALKITEQLLFALLEENHSQQMTLIS